MSKLGKHMVVEQIKKYAGSIEGIKVDEIIIDEPFLDFAARFAPIKGTILLMSGGESDCARYDILAVKPWLTFTGNVGSMSITINEQIISYEGDPFETLRMLLENFKAVQQKIQFPVSTGLFGYLSYDLKDYIEKLPRTSVDDLYLPQICLFAPSIIIVHDKDKKAAYRCITRRRVEGGYGVDGEIEFYNRISRTPPQAVSGFSGDPGGFKSGFTKTRYMEAIKRIKEYILSGHVYQVNMSQRFEMDFTGNPFTLFKKLFKKNPAPFFSYIQAGDHQIVSTSPERFIKKTGKKVETRPIKGTRPRGKTRIEDNRLKRELSQSKKDDAELSMIVDLLRNDMGKVCRGGSVRVSQHKRVEAYDNVYHLVSIVEGILDKDKDTVDLIKAVFPGGSITGCPKIRSMEIIDELEPVRRHIYTGAIGYMSFHDSMDLSIAIRTATIYNNKIIFSAGGGIVFDSDPNDEYEETLHKGKTMMEVFMGEEKDLERPCQVWINGVFKPLETAKISVTDQGFQYGYGFFETIRANNGKPQHLKAHMERFGRTWRHLFFEEPPDLSWDEIIRQVILKNGLSEETAAVKITATRGDREVPPYNHTLLVTARPYIHRLTEYNRPGLKLAVYPEPRQTPLANHKTLNYLYYLLAGKWAKAQGADEALILNPDGTVSETNTANILMIRDKRLILPVSPAVLPGIMADVVSDILVSWGYRKEQKLIQPEDLFSADLVMVTNSLMGTVPVLTLDGKNITEPSSDICEKINTIVL